MPIYEYEEVGTGKRVELFRTVSQRDSVPPGLKRVLSLSTPGTFTGSRLDPQSAEAAVPRAFRQLEQTMPRDRIERDCGFSARDIKRTWNFNQ